VKSTADRRPLATPQEVADYLQVPLNTVYDWRRRRTGPKASKVGIHLRYKWADVDAWLEAQSEVAA
jgi:excisionase family DNA binding protein